jgi:hypothetical protein
MTGRHVFAELAWTMALFGIAVVVGLGLLVLAFKLHALRSIDVLFYRGVVLIALVGVVTLGLTLTLGPRLHVSLGSALAAAVLSMSVNLSLLVLLPVTIDRSISVFLLGYMDKEPTTAFTADELRSAFTSTYLVHYQQIERRMHEQVLSRNIAEVGHGQYKITNQGRAFVNFAGFVAWLFDTDPRFVRASDKDQPKD